MDVFDKLLMRAVKIIFWQNSTTVLEAARLFAEIRLNFPSLLDLIPGYPLRTNEAEYLHQKLTEFGNTHHVLRSFRTSDGFLQWRIFNFLPDCSESSNFEMALERLLFEARLESTVAQQRMANTSDGSEVIGQTRESSSRLCGGENGLVCGEEMGQRNLPLTSNPVWCPYNR
ncbi:uncharacterized protein [Diadema setosum]|uniref:uncharacterized protein n=1 Tax=Diadema setosum TaxID=31175 RepID=UPI003B3AECF6